MPPGIGPHAAIALLSDPVLSQNPPGGPPGAGASRASQSRQPGGAHLGGRGPRSGPPQEWRTAAGKPPGWRSARGACKGSGWEGQAALSLLYVAARRTHLPSCGWVDRLATGGTCAGGSSGEAAAQICEKGAAFMLRMLVTVRPSGPGLKTCFFGLAGAYTSRGSSSAGIAVSTATVPALRAKPATCSSVCTAACVCGGEAGL